MTNARSAQRMSLPRLGLLARNTGSESIWYTELVMIPVTPFLTNRIGSRSSDELPRPE